MSPAVTRGATIRFSENGLAGFDGRAARVAFNRAAESIESTARDNPVNSWMREASRRAILRAFPEECALIEIGCGAGADAVYLAEHGYRVAAIDVSDRMVELARQRSVDRNVSHAVKTFRGRLTEVAPELRGLGWAPYMGAYANFSLTYEAALRPIGQTLHALLRPGGKFLFTLPNRLCLTEPLLALARGRPEDVFGRFRASWSRTIRDVRVPVRAYTAKGVRESLAGFFEVVAVQGVPTFMPPPALYSPSWERFWRELRQLDDRFSDALPWRYLGDHTMFLVRNVRT